MTRRGNANRLILLDAKILLGLVLVVMSAPYWRALDESRIYRDYMGLTPFTHVKVFGSVLDSDQITITGSMRKVRCDFVSLTGYVTVDSGYSVRVPVETDVEDQRGVSGNRPVSNLDQTWGPWSLQYDGGLGLPNSWEIYAHHVNCPGTPEVQTNLFAQGGWATTVKR